MTRDLKITLMEQIIYNKAENGGVKPLLCSKPLTPIANVLSINHLHSYVTKYHTRFTQSILQHRTRGKKQNKQKMKPQNTHSPEIGKSHGPPGSILPDPSLFSFLVELQEGEFFHCPDAFG